MKKSTLIATILYVIVMACAIGSLVALRNWASEAFSTDESQDNWTTWKAETARQEKGTGPVYRREAKSNEPPTLVLLRDYFGVAVTAVVLLGTILYISFFAMIRGAARTKFVPREDEVAANP